jgi:branched-chain amino acid transport system ATP-binding protein
VSILLIEQNARAALEVADHGYVLETGAIALEGPADELAVDPRVIETYLGAARKKPEDALRCGPTRPRWPTCCS